MDESPSARPVNWRVRRLYSAGSLVLLGVFMFFYPPFKDAYPGFGFGPLTAAQLAGFISIIWGVVGVVRAFLRPKYDTDLSFDDQRADVHLDSLLETGGDVGRALTSRSMWGLMGVLLLGSILVVVAVIIFGSF
jgi:hypothetical protein